MRRSRFRVSFGGPVDGVREATVTIHRDRALFEVRPLRRRRAYIVPLAAVAEMVVWRIVNAEARERTRERTRLRKERAKERRARSRAR